MWLEWPNTADKADEFCPWLSAFLTLGAGATDQQEKYFISIMNFGMNSSHTACHDFHSHSISLWEMNSDTV